VMMMCGLKPSRVAGQRLPHGPIVALAPNAAGLGLIAMARVRIAAAHDLSANPLAVMARASQKHLIRHGQRANLTTKLIQRRRCATLASVISSDAAKIVPADPAALIARSVASKRSAAVAKRAGAQRLSWR
jgi:hypothetical protein